MQTRIERRRSYIEVEKSSLRNDSVHVNVEIWGVVPKYDDEPIDLVDSKVLLYARKGDKIVIFPQNQTSKTEYEDISREEFSSLIWNLPIVAHGIQLTEELKNEIWEACLRPENCKTIFTITHMSHLSPEIHRQVA